MLEYYARELPAVEVNNTFYRMPNPDLLGRWASVTGEDFRFALKASRKITHFKKLKNCGDEVRYFLDSAAVLGERLGPVLFQLPPNFGFELERLQRFLDQLPQGRFAFEFRHPDWLQDATYQTLGAKGAALCIADYGHNTWQTIPSTASFAYFRLRATEYGVEEMDLWAQRISDTGVDTAYVFLKHDDGAAPKLAQLLHRQFDR